MKILIILLISVAGPEEIVIKKHSNISCSDAGNAWIDVNSVYKDDVSGDRGKQGSYTKDGKLVWGYYCK